jgi:hypothetical protein
MSLTCEPLAVFGLTTFSITTPKTSLRPLVLSLAASSDNTKSGEEERNKQQEELLAKAKELRKEAKEMEVKLRESKPISSTTTMDCAAATKVTDLDDSIWQLSYRFSSQPKDDDDSILTNYSGKITIRLTPDGYSEIVSKNDDPLVIQKVWGWDEEYSQEDEQQYLLFNMDVLFPKSDPKLALVQERCYFQARIEKEESDGSLVLKEGTVTVKKDVAEKTNGVWGLFKVAGILTEFRYVGDFIAKPATVEES